MTTIDKTLSPTSQRMQARIIDAAVECVAELGLSRTTLAQVATRAGVSQGVLVFHFKSKDGLLAETLRRLTEEYREAWVRELDGDTPLDCIIGLVRTDFSAAICTQRKLALWFAFWGEAGSKPLYSAICEAAETLRYEAMISACAAHVAEAGGPEPALLAHSIDAMTDGLWLQLHLYGAEFSSEAALAKALDHLRLILPEASGRL